LSSAAASTAGSCCHRLEGFRPPLILLALLWFVSSSVWASVLGGYRDLDPVHVSLAYPERPPSRSLPAAGCSGLRVTTQIFVIHFLWIKVPNFGPR
jgi:hypothetical protein